MMSYSCRNQHSYHELDNFSLIQTMKDFHFFKQVKLVNFGLIIVCITSRNNV